MTHSGGLAEHWPHLLPLVVLGLALGPRALRAFRQRIPAPARRERLLLAAALVAAAGGHALAAREHAGLQARFFAAVTVAQGLAALLVLRGAGRRALLAIGLGSVGLVLLWWESRTVGLRYGREPVGVADLLCVAVEVTALVLVGRLLRRPRLRLGPTGEQLAWGLIVFAGTLAVVS